MKIRLASFALCAAFLPACGADPATKCDPDPPVTVALTAVSEDVRALPVLSSGKVSLLGASVPDLHGEVRVKAALTNAASVQVAGLRFEESVDKVLKEITLVRQQQNDQDVTTGAELTTDAQLKFQFRMKNLADYALPAAAPHSGRVTLDWKFTGKCGDVQTGVARVEVAGMVKAVASAANLGLAGISVEPPNATRGNKLKLQLQSTTGDSLTSFKDAKIAVTYFGKGLVPELGVGTVSGDAIALAVNGGSRAEVSPTETLELFTSPSANASMPAFDFAGQAATTGALTEGKAVVTVTLSSAKKSAPTVVQTDTFAELVEFK